MSYVAEIVLSVIALFLMAALTVGSVVATGYFIHVGWNLVP